jgi:hypothetical protein
MNTKNQDLVICDKQLSVSGRWLKTASLTQEWFEDVDDPPTFLTALRAAQTRADLFTFWQRLPRTVPRYDYHLEWDSIAVLPVSTYENWYKNQINNKTRNLIVKAKKKGVEVRMASFDDDFVQGMTSIFNETPIRQERWFLHYGKSFETVKAQFSRYLFREELIGAYFEDELIGFIMLANAGQFAYLGQIIAFIRHRDKSPTNALLAKAVEVCAQRKVPFLVYALWPRGPLRDFKRHNGFDCLNLPRYYVPLNAKGRLAMKLRLHRNAADWMPENAIRVLKDMRSKFYSVVYRPKQTTL